MWQEDFLFWPNLFGILNAFCTLTGIFFCGLGKFSSMILHLTFSLKEVPISSIMPSTPELLVFRVLYSVWWGLTLRLLLKFLNFSFPDFPRFLCWLCFHFQVLNCFLHFLPLCFLRFLYGPASSLRPSVISIKAVFLLCFSDIIILRVCRGRAAGLETFVLAVTAFCFVLFYAGI